MSFFDFYKRRRSASKKSKSARSRVEKQNVSRSGPEELEERQLLTALSVTDNASSGPGSLLAEITTAIRQTAAGSGPLVRSWKGAA